MMNSSPADTAILIDVNDPRIVVSPRAQSTPGARKRRMMEQPSSTSKTPRKDPATNNKIKYEKNNEIMQKPPMHPDLPHKRMLELNKRDDSTRLRKTIQWLENGSKKLRDDLAEVRSELHEERRTTRMLKKIFYNSVRNAHIDESIIADVKNQLSDAMRNNSVQIPLNNKKSDSSIKKNNTREARKKTVEANDKMKKIETHSIDSGGKSSLKRRKIDEPCSKEIDNGSKYQMKKLQECEKNLQIRLEPCIEKKFHRSENLQDENYKKECEIEHLRELAVEQQEVIEYLRQALKERERKLDQLSNKKRKEEFYKQWLELEPVAEVDDEDQYEENDSALSSTPPSLSPQPCLQYQKNSLTRESYENLIIELEELQTKYIEEKQELLHAKSQVKDLEKALLQETRGSQNSRRALSDKLKLAEERELSLLDELSDIREQNELLEFRILELEETSGSRETPDTADSGIVSPELIYKIHQTNPNNKQQQQQQHAQQQRQQRAIATVIPYNNNNDTDNYNINNNDIDDNNNHMEKISFTSSKKSPLSLQESGIFDGDDDDDDDDDYNEHIEFTNCGTQTDTPSCELLQEVERLQQLREKIQERAVKVPVQIDNAIEINEDNNKIFYKEKIKELEEKLEIYQVADIERSKENAISKQRENDLLDENYRLIEKLHLLENQIQNYEKINKNNNKEKFIDKFFDTRDFGTSTTDDNIGLINCLNCQILKKDYYDSVQKFSQAEYSFRKKYINLKNKEIAFANILKEIDNIWCRREVNYNNKLKENQDIIIVNNIERMNLIKKIDELEKISQFMDVGENFEMDNFLKYKPTLIDDVQNNISSNQVINVTNDLVSQVSCNNLMDNVDGVVESQIKNQVEKYNIEVPSDSIVKTSETKTLEKVRKRWKCRSEREGWAMKVSKKFQDNNRNNRRSIDKHRLVIYSEICV